MNCTECNGPLPRAFRQGKLIKNHVTCPPISKRTWPTAYKPSDLDELKRMWDELPAVKRIRIRTILYEGILKEKNVAQPKRFSLTVKSGLTTLATVQGTSVDSESLTIADMDKVVEVEQFLERLFNLRFHIHEVKT